MAGPVKAVQVPAALHPGAVFEAIAPPPDAGATVAACAMPLKHNINTIARMIFAPLDIIFPSSR